MIRRQAFSFVAAVLAVVAAAGAADAAGVLTTPLAPRSGRAFGCMVTNAGTKQAEVLIELVSMGGNVQTSAEATMAPGTATGHALASDSGTALLYCRVTVLAGSKRAIRASYCVAGGQGTSVYNAPCAVAGEAS
jgi:hypothetical protein